MLFRFVLFCFVLFVRSFFERGVAMGCISDGGEDALGDGHQKREDASHTHAQRT